MSEIIGLLASVGTLLQATQGAVQLCMDLYRMPEEIKILQEQLVLFEKILRVAESSSTDSTGSTVRLAVSNAREALDDLNETITVKLIEGGAGRKFPYSRRLNWLRCRDEVKRLGARLSVAREALRDALSIDLFVSTGQLNLPILIFGDKFDQTRTRFVLGTQNPGTMTIEAPSHHNLRRSKNDSSNQITNFARTVEVPRPASSFEKLPSFLPETYIVDNGAPTLDMVIYNAYERDTSSCTRTNECSLYFARTPRRWIRVSVSVTISIELGPWLQCSSGNL
ncbi:hypothetical protein GQ53DRAFT_134116 [Thozetella sp. PMI_491]|nr:hypothetical protein GQ53DRAFT_134116 [Thozetella sp. PMI_491]